MSKQPTYSIKKLREKTKDATLNEIIAISATVMAEKNYILKRIIFRYWKLFLIG
jgi:hypothetical protein